MLIASGVPDEWPPIQRLPYCALVVKIGVTTFSGAPIAPMSPYAVRLIDVIPRALAPALAVIFPDVVTSESAPAAVTPPFAGV